MPSIQEKSFLKTKILRIQQDDIFEIVVPNNQTEEDYDDLLSYANKIQRESGVKFFVFIHTENITLAQISRQDSERILSKAYEEV